MSVVIRAFCVFVFCSKLAASLPFPEEYVRRYLAAAHGAPASSMGTQNQQNQQINGINPIQAAAYASQPMYPPIPNAGNYYPPIDNLDLDANLPRDYRQNNYAGKQVQANAQASTQSGNVYPQTINPNQAVWEQQFYRNQLQQKLQERNMIMPQQIPFDINNNQKFIGRHQIQADSNPTTHTYVTPLINLEQTQQNVATSKNNEYIAKENLAASKKIPFVPPIKQPYQINEFMINDPKIQNIISKTKLKKRYLVIHPDGTVMHVNNLDEVIKNNPNYVLLNPGHIKSSHASALASAKVETKIKQENKPSDIKQFRITEVTSQKDKSSKQEKNVKKPEERKDISDLEKQIKIITQAKATALQDNKDSKIKYSKLNKNESVATASATVTNGKARNERKEDHTDTTKINTTNSETVIPKPKTKKKSCVKFSVKNAQSKSDIKLVKKDDNKESKRPESTPTATASAKAIVTQNKKQITSESKSSTSVNENKAKQVSSATTKTTSKCNEKKSTNADSIKEQNNKIPSLSSAAATSSVSNKNEQSKKSKHDSKIITSTALSAASSSKSNKHSHKSSKATVEVKKTTNGPKTVIKTETNKEKTLEVIPVTKDLKKNSNNGENKNTKNIKQISSTVAITKNEAKTSTASAKSSSSIKHSKPEKDSKNNKSKINNNKEDDINSVSNLLAKSFESNSGNVVVVNTKSDNNQDSKSETEKMLQIIKDLGKEDIKDKVLIFLVMPPVIDRDLHTTIYPDGTIIDEITETTWDSDDEDAEPKVVTRTKVRNINDPPETYDYTK